MQRYSLVMPVFNGADRLREVLAPLSELNPDWEVLIVDDDSQDQTQEILKEYSFRILRQTRRGGQSAARNRAAAEAVGEILLFLDSDVVVEPDTLYRMVRFLEDQKDLDGVFGCYSQVGYAGEPPLSRFRNLLHRYVHQTCAGKVGTFWAGLGAIRRERFLDGGAFDSRLDGIEDVELGTRLSRSGSRFWLEPSFEGRHLKRWDLPSMIHTDTNVRAAAWTFYGWLGLTPRQGLNLSPALALPPALLLLAVLTLPLSSAASAACLMAYLLANLPLYFFFARSAGWSLGLLSVLYLVIHQTCCLLGAGWGSLRYLSHILSQNTGEISFVRLGMTPEPLIQRVEAIAVLES